MEKDLRVIFNDNGPTGQRIYAKRDLRGKVKSKRGLRGKVNMQIGAFMERSKSKEGPSWKGQIMKRDLRVVYNGNPGQIPGLMCHRIIKRMEIHMHMNVKLFMIFITSGDTCW